MSRTENLPRLRKAWRVCWADFSQPANKGMAQGCPGSSKLENMPWRSKTWYKCQDGSDITDTDRKQSISFTTTARRANRKSERSGKRRPTVRRRCWTSLTVGSDVPRWQREVSSNTESNSEQGIVSRDAPDGPMMLDMKALPNRFRRGKALEGLNFLCSPSDEYYLELK